MSPSTPLDIQGCFWFTRDMVKHKKKRTKRYTGEDAAIPTSSQPTIHRVQAVDRGKFGQWWYEKKRAIRIGSIATGVVAFISWLVFELFQIIL